MISQIKKHEQDNKKEKSNTGSKKGTKTGR